MSYAGAGLHVVTRLQRPEDDEGVVALLEAAFDRWPHAAIHVMAGDSDLV